MSASTPPMRVRVVFHGGERDIADVLVLADKAVDHPLVERPADLVVLQDRLPCLRPSSGSPQRSRISETVRSSRAACSAARRSVGPPPAFAHLPVAVMLSNQAHMRIVDARHHLADNFQQTLVARIAREAFFRDRSASRSQSTLRSTRERIMLGEQVDDRIEHRRGRHMMLRPVPHEQVDDRIEHRGGVVAPIVIAGLRQLFDTIERIEIGRIVYGQLQGILVVR